MLRVPGVVEDPRLGDPGHGQGQRVDQEGEVVAETTRAELWDITATSWSSRSPEPEPCWSGQDLGLAGHGEYGPGGVGGQGQGGGVVWRRWGRRS